MKRRLASGFPRILFALLIMLGSNVAFAAEELVLFVFKDNNAGSGLTVTVDGKSEQTTGADGGARFDLKGGGHSVQIRDGQNTLHSFRFNSAAGQNVDIVVALAFGVDPTVTVESYFPKESPSVRARGATGTLLGKVTSYGEPVENATITLSDGTSRSWTTDASGSYRLTLPRGIYNVVIEHPEFISQRAEGFRVIANIELGANFEVIPLDEAPVAEGGVARPAMEEIITVAAFLPSQLGVDERYATGVVDTLGSEDLARYADTQVAAAVVRVPSVTIRNDKFIFIRGLGGRYVTTTLNGSTLPSTDPSRRTVPLDIFPTNFVNQLDVNKTFTAGMPGESTGGNLVINTRSFPAEEEGSLSLSLGYTTDLTGDDVLTDPIDGDWDWLGIDDGSRDTAAVPRAISAAQEFNDFLPDNVNRALGIVGGNYLANTDFEPEEETAWPLVKASGSYGKAFELDNGSELGFFLAGNYRNKWEKRDEGIQRTYSTNPEQLDPLDDFVFQEFTNKVDLNGLLSIGWNVGNNSYASNSLITRVTDSRVKEQVGRDGDELLPSIRRTIEWIERQFLSQQFNGNHVFGDDEQWVGDWQLTLSRAERDSPDRRDSRYDLEGADDIFNLEVPTVARRYDEIVDDNLDLSGDLQYAFGEASTASFGAQIITRERDADSETYGFRGGQTLDDNSPNLQVIDVINQSTITGETQTGYTFDDKTLPSDSYEADLDLYALYGEIDSLFADKYQIVAGLRWEDFEQTTDTFSLEGEQEAVQSVLDESEFLPSLGFNWLLTDNQQLRFAVTKTVSRPDFKESSNATFFDPIFDVRVRGNPNLDISTAISYDARYEYYWNELDSFSFAVFYKDLDDPIERVVQKASGTASNSRTFENADSGEVYGVELDLRKEFSLNDSLSKTFFVATNASWIESEVDLPELASQGKSKPPLQGQPEYTFNLIFGYDDIENNIEATLLANQNGDTVVDRGVSGSSDIVQEPKLDLDFIFSWGFADQWTLGFKARNLLDEETEFTQDGRTFQQFTTGTELEASIKYDF